MKKELRSKLRAILGGIPPEELQRKSRVATSLMIQEPEYKNAEIIMIYLSLPNEADTTSLVLQAWQDRKKVVAPQVTWESRQMIPVEIRDLNEDVTETGVGIRQPVRGLPIPIELIDLVIVPGLGFDPFGNRLGRGRGFYDRFLAKPQFRGVATGFALEAQVVESIPAGAHDIKVSMLATDEQIRRFDP